MNHVQTIQTPSIDISMDGQFFTRIAVLVDGEYAGTMDFKALSPSSCTFRQFFVVPKFRRQGIGAFLLDRAVVLAFDHGAHILECECAKGNLSALKYYQNRDFYIEGDDEDNWFLARLMK